MHLMEKRDVNELCMPAGLEEITNKTCEQLLPMQSKEKYNSVYQKFQTWRKTKNVSISENVMLSYFTELMETMQPSSLWAMYSMLKTTIKIYDQCDIGVYSNLIALLKRNSENYTPKKSSVLSDENIEKFLNEAPDDQFLAIKVKSVILTIGSVSSKTDLSPNLTFFSSWLDNYLPTMKFAILSELPAVT